MHLLFFIRSSLELAEDNKVVDEGFRRYRETQTDDLKKLVDHYSIKDVAMKGCWSRKRRAW